MDYEKIASDFDHWHNENRRPPLCPNYFEYNIYKNLIGDFKKQVCLFGMTKELIPLSDFVVDLNPINKDIKCYKENWLNVKNIQNFKTDVIIGDGCLNLVGLDLLEVLKTECKQFISRVFLKKQDWMKYASFFPVNFPYSPVLIPTQIDILIACWSF